MKSTSKTAAAYIRASTDMQQAVSPESQLEKIREYAEKNNYLLPPGFIYMEIEGVSGRSAARRDAFNRMIAEAKRKPAPFDAVLVWKFSRFARNQEESVFYKSMLRRLGVEVVSISEPIIDGPFGQLIERIIEWMDEYYSIRLGEEVKRSMTVLAREGRPLTTAPMGYRMENGQLMPDPREALIINEIFSRFTSGESLLAISREFNARGIRTHRGGLIESRTLSYILQNPVYIGKTRWTPTGRTRRNFSNPDTIIAHGIHEPIISHEMWEKAQSIISSGKNSHTASSSKNHSWLSGLVRCSACGNWLVVSGKSSMQCGAYAKGKCEISHSVTKRALQSAIILQLRRDAQKSVSTYLSRKKPLAASCPPIFQNRALCEITRRLERLREAYLSGAEDLECYQKAKKELEHQADAIRKSLETKIPADTLPDPIDTSAWLNDPIFILEDNNTSEEEKYKAAHDTISCCIYDKHKRTLSVIYKID